MLQIFRNLRIVSLTRRNVVNIRWYSDDDSSDDEKKKQKILKKNADNANKRLQELLNSMSMSKSEGTANVIRPKNKRKEALEKKVEEPDPQDIRTVTQKIAEKIGGDVKKTEAELLSSLLGLTEQKSSLNDIIGGLKVEKDEIKSKAQMVKQALSMSQQHQSTRPKRAPLTQAQRKERIPMKVVNVDIFGGQPLNIFEKANEKPDICKTWASLEAREMRLAVTHPPRNYFEKMALWTEQGKIWKFPIDNEQGWEEEHQTDFTEHVMLEMHLEGWCPSKGPVRHFMELVCVGLSKNNFLSAKEKYDHIMWYKGYFEEKKETLGNLMTLGIEDGEKQLES